MAREIEIFFINIHNCYG